MPGEGSIFKFTRLDPDGKPQTRWRAQLSTGPRGKRRYATRTCRTRSEAREALEELRLESGRPASPSPLALGTYLRSWLDETARPSVSANTLRGYEDAVAHLAPLADVPLADLTPEAIEYTLNRLTTNRRRKAGDTSPPKPASPKTVRNVQLMLRAALGLAERRGHIAKNPAKLVPLQRVPRTSMDVLTPERARAILAAIAGDRYEAGYALGFVGLRASEVLGLTWDDVDLKAGVARVRYQLVGSGETAVRAELKTAASGASVPLPGFVIDRLKAHRLVQLEERAAAGVPTEDGYVLVTPNGLPVNGSWYTKHFQSLLEASGLPKMRLHVLRHGAATLLVGAGVHPRVAQELLRHASSKTTMEIYSHVSAAQQRTAVDLLQKAIDA